MSGKCEVFRNSHKPEDYEVELQKVGETNSGI